jgi:hypothetical protein
MTNIQGNGAKITGGTIKVTGNAQINVGGKIIKSNK